MATTPLCSARGLVGPARRGWTPEEVAQYELALYRGLASNKKAQRVFLQKVRIVETVRAKQHQVVPQLAGSTNTQATTSTGAGGRLVGLIWAAARRRHGAPCAPAEVRSAAAQDQER